MAIDFPNTPVNGDSYSVGGKTWEFDGSSWVAVSSASLISLSAIEEKHLGNGAVSAAKLQSNCVTATKIVSNAVTQAKMDSTLSLFTITTSTNRSTDVPSPFMGQLVYETDTSKIKAWGGSSWSTISLTL